MKIALPFIFSLFAFSSLFSQSNIQQPTSINSSGAAPAASAQLDVQATDKGMLVPRMTSAQRSAIASPANGLLVYDTDTGSFWYNQGGTWLKLAVSGGAVTSFVADADNNTKVQTEASANEDIIRFDLGGTEKMVLTQNASGAARLELPDVAGTTIIGQEAGVNNVPVAGASGENNTFLGYRSGNANTTGGSNVAIGASSLYSNTSGSLNTANGLNALYNNSTGNENTAIGSFALVSNTTGLYNTATGSNALLNNMTGQGNTANGNNALHSNTTGNLNTANGLRALYSNTTGDENTANGTDALWANTTGNYNTANGKETLYSNTTGNNNTANGWKALWANTTGINNTANGWQALYSNTTGKNNTANGADALVNNTEGLSNTASGFEALYYNTHGSFNTANGLRALYSNTTGSSNTANGSSALYSNTTGTNNTAIGVDALNFNTTGEKNSALGSSALYFNTTGNNNTANGWMALSFNSTGKFNTASGSQSLISNSTGEGNTANGVVALSSNTTGFNNTAVGAIALSDNTTGSYNIGMGYQAGFYHLATADNQIAIGITTGTAGANKAIIGNSSQTWIGGQVGWSAISDARIKEQVKADVPGLSFIKELRPVTYHLNIHKQKEIMDRLLGDKGRADSIPDWTGKYDIEQIRMTGFLAQEVEAAAKKANYDFSGIDVPKTEGGLYSIRYAEFVVPLVKAVQEQQLEIEKLEIRNLEIEKLNAEIHASRAENAALKTQLETQAAMMQKITAALQGAGIAVEK